MGNNSNVLPMQPRTVDDAYAELRAKMMRDASAAWNQLVALATYGFDESVRLTASLAVLAHTVGPPTAKVQVSQGPRRRSSLPTLPQLSVREAEAIKVLVEAQRARQGEED